MELVEFSNIEDAGRSVWVNPAFAVTVHPTSGPKASWIYICGGSGQLQLFVVGSPEEVVAKLEGRPVLIEEGG